MIRTAIKASLRLPKRGVWNRPEDFSPLFMSTGGINTWGSSILSVSCYLNDATVTSDRLVFTRSYTSTSNSLKEVSITYIEADGTSKTINAEVGTDLMSVAHENDIELEGACGGELACSTCHLVFDPEIYDSLPEKEDEEDDMLDLAFEVTDTSRLGCQITVQENFDGTTVQIPDDGF